VHLKSVLIRGVAFGKMRDYCDHPSYQDRYQMHKDIKILLNSSPPSYQRPPSYQDRFQMHRGIKILLKIRGVGFGKMGDYCLVVF
jgi:hypothetical protein